jgi:hypothetical protein
VNKYKIMGCSYTDLLRVSYADAVDDQAEDVESIVFNMFTVSQVMAKI